MRSSAALLVGFSLLLVGVAVGGAVGYLMGQGEVAPERVAPAAGDERPKGDGRGAENALSATPPAPAGEVPAPAVPRAGRAAAREASPSGTSETGDGKITGTVLGPAGEPLVGALVRAMPDFPWVDESAGGPASAAEEPPAGSPPPLTDAEVEIAAFAARIRRRQGAMRETRTDASGAYELTGLASCEWDVAAWLPGWSVRRAQDVGSVKSGARIDFVATPLRSVVISVLMPDGRPASSATVEWELVGGDDSSSTEWSPRFPRATVSPGTYRFKASASVSAANPDEEATQSRRGWRGQRHFFGSRFHDDDSDDSSAAFVAEPQEVVVGEGETRLTLQLRGRPGIAVDVKFADAAHTRAVRVAAVRIGGGSGGDARRTAPDLLGGDARSEWTDGTAPVMLAGIEPGVYLVGVTFRGGRVGPTATVTVGTEPARQSFTIDDDGLQDVVRLRVLGPDGAPVTGVEIEHGVRTAGGSAGASVDVPPGTDGSFLVPHFATGAPTLGHSSHSSGNADESLQPTYYIEIESPRFGKERAEYRPGADSEVTIRLREPTTLQVTVAGLDSAEIRSRALLFVDCEGRDRGSEGVDVPPSGIVTVGALTPGPATIVLRTTTASGRHRRWRARYEGTVLARRDVVLVAGDNVSSIAVAPSSDLVVSFDASGEAPKLLPGGASGWDGDGVPSGVPAGDGQVRFPGLIAGRYRLKSRAGEMTVDVPTSGVIAFRPRPYNAYLLEVEAGSYLVEIGMRTGDLVVAIDGAEFKDKLTMEAAMAVARTKPLATFTIERDGTRVEVPTDANRFYTDDKSSFTQVAR